MNTKYNFRKRTRCPKCGNCVRRPENTRAGILQYCSFCKVNIYGYGYSQEEGWHLIERNKGHYALV